MDDNLMSAYCIGVYDGCKEGRKEKSRNFDELMKNPRGSIEWNDSVYIFASDDDLVARMSDIRSDMIVCKETNNCTHCGIRAVEKKHGVMLVDVHSVFYHCRNPNPVPREQKMF
jgi:hypothetical protein